VNGVEFLLILWIICAVFVGAITRSAINHFESTGDFYDFLIARDIRRARIFLLILAPISLFITTIIAIIGNGKDDDGGISRL
jgi:hypothetical protein